MGWGYGVARDGREIGYSVDATCDHPGCTAGINRGLGHLCGAMHDEDQYGCGKYFCADHLGPYEHEDGTCCQVCEVCRKFFDANRSDGKDGYGDPADPEAGERCSTCGGDGFDPDSLNGNCACGA